MYRIIWMKKMDRKYFYSLIQQDNHSDYEIYVNTASILSCQKNFADLHNQDELQFQMVHQWQEMFMKLIAYTLLDIDDYIQQKKTLNVIHLFKRVYLLQDFMINLFGLLETMSPKDYQEIRELLGNGSGSTSPGFRTLLQMFNPLWESYQQYYLINDNLTAWKVYQNHKTHYDAYIIAESLIEFELRFRRFLKRHFEIIERMIGGHSKSLTGRDVEKLKTRIDTAMFPDLWEVRNKMTNEWGLEYGFQRESIKNKKEDKGT